MNRLKKAAFFPKFIKLIDAEDIDLNPIELAEFYKKYFTYYGTLVEVDQKNFIERSLRFISQKSIIGAAGFIVDNRVKAIIAASAVQLTLGLEVWNLDHFEEIELHASDFSKSNNKPKYSGLTSLQGSIHLSWKSFIHGYTIVDDNRNLGLHEFTHALRFNSINGNAQDYFVDHYFNKWLTCAYEAFTDIQKGWATIFREYGGSNINEFLSVCIEHYFESPKEIKEKYPLLYFATGALLNQETTNSKTKIGVRNNFLLEQSNLLPGMNLFYLKGAFTKHWSFKLFLFVFAITIYSVVSTYKINAVSFVFLFLTSLIYLWYDFNAVKIQFVGKEIHFEKGATFFKKRKTWTSLISHLVSIRMNEEEWVFTYYNIHDEFFHEEKVYPPNGVSTTFLSDCKLNKIAVLKQ